jgi:uncharacterized protein (TIGR02145 family)
MIFQNIKYNYFVTGILSCITLILTLILSCEKIEPERIIKVKTESISNIQYSSSIAEGILIDFSDGGISEHGHCWGTTENPTIGNPTKTMFGSRTTKGSFQSHLEELTPGTNYYIRAYGQKGDLVSYGESKSFTTLAASLPTVTTYEASEISMKSAKCGGEITADGGHPVTARGICWNTTGNPSINDNPTEIGSGLGGFTSELTELSVNTKYYVKAYATNNIGTNLGNQIVFTTLPGNLPTVITNDPAEVTMSSARCSGKITDDGGYPVTARGLCWNTTGNPSISDNPTEIGSGLGDFESELTGLIKRTKYYVKAYATNQEGTNMGNEVTFTTSDLPAVSTVEIGTVKPNSINVVGNVTDDGDTEVTSRGFCWDVNPVPTISGASIEAENGKGEFNETITDLEPAQEYFIRAYATNINGTEYGQEWAVTTPYTDARDFKTYPVIHIGEQYWMAENLNYGDFIPSTANQLENEVVEKYCYDNNEDNCGLYGGYYTWLEMMQYTNTEAVRGVCPSGWHIPSDEEWKTLEMAIGMSRVSADSVGWRGFDEGGKLKLEGTEFWEYPNEGATNEIGFSALPGGFFDITEVVEQDKFKGAGTTATFWTSTSEGEFARYYHHLDYSTAKTYRTTGYIGNGTPVRCVKD